MIPVKQTLLGPEQGNCFAACIASILELPISSVPNFCLYHDWFQRVNEFLEPLGLCYIEVDISASGLMYGLLNNNNFYVLSGKSPNYDCLHAVVAQGDVIVHDPHPDNKGLLDRQEVGLIVSLGRSYNE